MAFTLMSPLGVMADQRTAILYPASLDGDSLDYAELYIYLEGDQWRTDSLNPDYFTLNNPPGGLSVTDAVYRTATEGSLVLVYSGPGIEEDIPNFRVTISGEALTSGQDLTTFSIPVFAMNDPDRFVVNVLSDTKDINPGDGVCEDANYECSLRAAIEEANEWTGEQTIFVPGGVYNLDSSFGTLEITEDVQITGSGIGETVINSDGWFRVMKIAPEVSVKLSTLTVSGGMAGGNGEDRNGGGIYNEGNLELFRVGVEGGGAYGAGGGIYSTGPLKIEQSEFTNNGQYEYGPDDFRSVPEGGAIFFDGAGTNPLTIYGTEFKHNQADSSGGAIYIRESSLAVINSSSFIDNSAGSHGGAIVVDGSQLVMHGTEFIANSSGSYGGGAMTIKDSNNHSSSVDGQLVKFMNNKTVGNGGAILMEFLSLKSYYGSTKFSASEFIENEAEGNGAILAFGLFVEEHEVTIEDSSIVGNIAGNGENITNDSQIHVDASHNYWGEGMDPTMTVSGDVNVAPWFKDVELTQPGPTDALSYLVVEGIDSELNFDFRNPAYQVMVRSDIETLVIVAGVFVSSSKIRVNDYEVEPDTPIEVGVPEGYSEISIEVIGEDDAQQEYVLYVYREEGPQSEVFFVDSLEDTVDAYVGDGICADDYGNCTLRAAIMEANATDAPDVIFLPEGEIVLSLEGIDEEDAQTGDLDILYPLTITGAGAELTIINGGGVDRVFDVWTDDFLISDVTITGGVTQDNRGGAAIYTHGYSNMGGYCNYHYCDEVPPVFSDYQYIIRDVVIEGNSVDKLAEADFGGAIENSGSMLLERADLVNNHSKMLAGGLFNTGFVKLVNSNVTDNRANYVGGIYNKDDAYLVVEGSEIKGNVADRDGGGIVNDNGYVWILESIIEGNEAYGYGGVATISASYMMIDSSEVKNNIAHSVGGGASVTSESIMKFKNSTITNNYAEEYGGGFAIVNGGNELILEVRDSLIEGNEAGEGGSLIYVDDSISWSSIIYFIENHILNLEGDRDEIFRNQSLADLGFTFNFWGEGGPRFAETDNLYLYPYYLDEEMQVLGDEPNKLADLVVSGGQLIKASSDPDVEAYGIIADHDADTISLTPYASHPDAPIGLFIGELGEDNGVLLEHGKPWELDLEQLAQYDNPLLFILVAHPYDDHATNLYMVYIMQEQVIHVNTTEDTVDDDPEDGLCLDANGNCSLRAALMHVVAENTGAVIHLPAGEYTLTRSGSDSSAELDPGVGDLDVLMPVRIQGAGSEVTIIDATELNARIFEVVDVPFHLSGVTLRGGYEETGDGGAIYLDGCRNIGCESQDRPEIESSLSDVVITSSQAFSGGAIFVWGQHLLLSSVEIRNNTATDDGGGIFVGYSASSLRAENSRFVENFAGSMGGAISGYGRLEIVDSQLEDNEAYDSGGAIFSGESLVLADSQLKGNRADDAGGAIYSYGIAEIDNSVFEDNRVSAEPEYDEDWRYYTGGAITNHGDMDIQNSTFQGNQGVSGGAIYNNFEAFLSIKGSTFHENNATYDGGAVFNRYMMTIEETNFEQNRGRNGAAVANIGELQMKGSTLTGNQASEYGGGILNGNRLTLEDSSLIMNEAGLSGGGIHAEALELYSESSYFEDKVVTFITGIELSENKAGQNGGGMSVHGITGIERSTFSLNEADGIGGGLYLTEETHIVNSTFAQNEAVANGGAIFAAGPWLTIAYSTISGNFVSEAAGGQVSEAGGLAAASQTTEIVNSILYGNMLLFDGFTQMADCSGNIYPIGANIIGESGCQILYGEEAGIVLQVDPLLGALADNGGKVKTMALLPGSPAIDGAVEITDVSSDMVWVYNPAQDARQIHRPQGATRDIGAYEVVLESHSFIALYDDAARELVIRFGSDLRTDSALDPENFAVSLTRFGETVQLGIVDARYGEDYRSVILKLEAPDELDGWLMNVVMDTNAVRFVDNIQFFRSEAEALTQWQLRQALQELFELEDSSSIDTGIIVRALAEGTLADLFGDSYHDPAIVRFLLKLIEAKYVHTVEP